MQNKSLFFFASSKLTTSDPFVMSPIRHIVFAPKVRFLGQENGVFCVGKQCFPRRKTLFSPKENTFELPTPMPATFQRISPNIAPFLTISCCILPFLSVYLPPATHLPPPRNAHKHGTFHALVAEWQMKHENARARENGCRCGIENDSLASIVRRRYFFLGLRRAQPSSLKSGTSPLKSTRLGFINERQSSFLWNLWDS